jgi:2-oxoisovalerate dehydrogenase E1 component
MENVPLFKTMTRIRVVEERMLELFSRGLLFGTTHTSIGQEAVAAAVGAQVREGDQVFAPHRCHGYYLACGGSLDAFFGEVMGRETGACAGRAGSQQLHFPGFYACGVQGGVVGNATGTALALSMKHSDAIAVVFLGDGTLGEGLVYESLNFSALRSLPILFVVENNRYAQSTPVEQGVSGSMIVRAEAFGIAAHAIESNDVCELEALFSKRFAWVREQRRPFFEVVHTYRLAPHSKGDDVRAPAELEAHRANDPLELMRMKLGRDLSDVLLDEARNEIDEAVARAESAPVARDIGLAPKESRIEPLPAPWVVETVSFVKRLNAALFRLLGENSEVFVIGEDVVDPYGGAFKVTQGLSTRFPGRVISTPISEAGIVAWSVGAALQGLRPIAEIMFGDFLALAGSDSQSCGKIPVDVWRRRPCTVGDPHSHGRPARLRPHA